MTDRHDLTELDVDGAIQETAERVGVNRGDLLKRAAVGGGAIVGTSSLLGALPGMAFGASKSPKASASDVDILNFALTLEYLEAAFYAEAVSEGRSRRRGGKFAKVVAKRRGAHVAFLKAALGAKAVKKPTFDFKGTTAGQATFQKTAMALEDTGVAAYPASADDLERRRRSPLRSRSTPSRRATPPGSATSSARASAPLPAATAVRPREDEGPGAQDRHRHRLHHRLTMRDAESPFSLDA